MRRFLPLLERRFRASNMLHNAFLTRVEIIYRISSQPKISPMSEWDILDFPAMTVLTTSHLPFILLLHCSMWTNLLWHVAFLHRVIYKCHTDYSSAPKCLEGDRSMLWVDAFVLAVIDRWKDHWYLAVWRHMRKRHICVLDPCCEIWSSCSAVENLLTVK